MGVATSLGRTYKSPEENKLLRIPSKEITISPPTKIVSKSKSTMDQMKDFIVQPWFLGVLGGVIFLLIVLLLLCCLCKRSSNKKEVDNLPIELQNTESVRKAPR